MVGQAVIVFVSSCCPDLIHKPVIFTDYNNDIAFNHINHQRNVTRE
jgi:hypothetical protein